MSRILFVLILIAAFAGSGQARPAASAGPDRQTAAQAKPRNPTDSQIESAIRQKLAKGKLATDRFTVSVKNGVATFEGRTSVIQHKGSATRIAHASGATGVRNNIIITDEAKAKAAQKLEAARVRAQAPPGTPNPPTADNTPVGPPRAHVIQPTK